MAAHHTIQPPAETPNLAADDHRCASVLDRTASDDVAAWEDASAPAFSDVPAGDPADAHRPEPVFDDAAMAARSLAHSFADSFAGSIAPAHASATRHAFWLAAMLALFLAGCGSGSSHSSAPSPGPGPGTALDGHVGFLSDLEGHAHYHGAYYIEDPEFHFPVENTASRDVTLPYTIRIDGVDIPGYGAPRHTLSVPAHGTVDGAAFQNPYDTDLNPGAGPRPTGLHVFQVVLDPDGRFTEATPGLHVYRCKIAIPTSNNTYPVAAADSRSDLRFIDPHVHGPEMQKVRFHFQVTNGGHSVSAATHWRLLRNGAVVIPTVVSGAADRSIAALAPAAVITVVADFIEPSATGEVLYTLVLDPDEEAGPQVYTADKRVDRWQNMDSQTSFGSAAAAVERHATGEEGIAAKEPTNRSRSCSAQRTRPIEP